MPELPEVETVRRALARRLIGRTLTGFSIPRTTFNKKPSPKVLGGAKGLKLSRVRRRGKYLILVFSRGRNIILHLGMSGHLRFGETGTHTRLSLFFGKETLHFEDPRRFGRAGCLLPELGPEPLDKDFHPNYLYTVLRKRKAPIKALLMDQSIVAGIGNIYATEALFAAGLRPARAGTSLTLEQIRRLYTAIKDVLRKAVALGGSTLADSAYLDPLGRRGRAQRRHKIYGRGTGACGHALKSTPKPISGRTSLYCPRCQT